MSTARGIWTKPEDSLPDDETTVLIRLEGETDPVWLGFYVGHGWRYINGGLIGAPVRVTGWMHLPSPEDAA